jgi:hypothetical protein
MYYLVYIICPFLFPAILPLLYPRKESNPKCDNLNMTPNRFLPSDVHVVYNNKCM